MAYYQEEWKFGGCFCPNPWNGSNFRAGQIKVSTGRYYSVI